MKTLILPLFIFCTLTCDAQILDTLNYALGKVDYAKNSEFVKIPDQYANKSGMYLRKEALDAFIIMRQAAKADGIELRIISAARSFYHQKSIWEAKWTGKKLVNGKNLSATIADESTRAVEILKYSSMPGTSRHHWGTDIDINSLNPAYFESGKGKKEYEWLRGNAHLYGFCQVYSEKGKERQDGYEEEKWHWSYVPIASVLTKFHVTRISEKELYGFAGDKSLSLAEKRKYILGISSYCK